MSGQFLFASLDSRAPETSRKVHIRRLYDVLQLCIHRDDMPRARRAWSILARCKEVHWMTMWTTAVHILGEDLEDEEKPTRKIEFLREMMLRYPADREPIIKELVLRLIISGKHQEALDELELYLPSFPFQDDPLLHIYAGLISLYVAQPESLKETFNLPLLRDAQSHFERAMALDPDNPVATAFLSKIPTLSQTFHPTQRSQNNADSDDDMLIDEPQTKRYQKRKRLRSRTS